MRDQLKLQETKHACLRKQQRSIPDIAIDLLMKFGLERDVGGGCVRYSFDKRALKNLSSHMGNWRLNKMEQLEKAYIVVKGDLIITAAYSV